MRVALVLMLVCTCGVANAARLPDWAKEIAAMAPPMPEGFVEDDSRILLQETLLTVREDGSMVTRRRTATQAISPQASEIGLGFFPFDEDTKKLRSKAWHVSAKGKVKKSSNASEMDLTLADLFLTDSRTRVVAIPDVDKGSLVFFEFVAEETPTQLAYQELFFNDVPALQVRVIVELAPGWDVRHAWLRQNGPDPVVEGNRRTWQLDRLEVPPLVPELSEGFAASAPLLQISMVPPDGQTLGSAFRSWADVASWFEELSAGRDAVDPAIRAATSDAVPEETESFFGEVESIATYVRDQVRYVAKHVGIGGYQPHAAGDVLSRLYGDCKDKSTLMRSMLASRDTESYPILISLSRNDTVSRDVPTLRAFDHLIVGVPVPEGVEIPDRFRSAVVATESLGELLIVDTTNEYAAIGDVSASLGGKTGLVVAGDRHELVPLPDDDPSGHGVLRRFDATMQPDGAVSMTVVEESWGQPAMAMRMARASSNREFESDSVRLLESIWTGSKLSDISVIPENEEGRFVRTAQLDLPPIDPGDQAELLRVFPSAMGHLPRTSVSRRTTPIAYPHPLTLRVESRIEGLPTSTTRPRDHESSGDGWSVRSEHRFDAGVLESDWELRMTQRKYDPDDFTNLRKLWSAAGKSSSVVVERSAD